EIPAPPALEARGQGGGAPEAGAAGAALKGTTLLTGIAVAQAYTGHPLEARRLVTAAADRVGEDPTEVLPLHLAAFAAEFWSGDLTGAWRAADAYAEALGRRGDALYGAVLLWRGQVATALTRLRASHPGAAAHAAALVGDAEMAERYLAAGEDQWTELARPWVAVAAGRVSEGAELAAAYASRAAAAGLVGFELLALHDVARLGGARRVAARVAGLRHEGALAAAVAAHVAAAAERSGPGLWAASVEFERLGYLVFAAEAAAGALRAGTPGAAARAHMLASRCEGARTPLLAALAAPALTRRELEIATLAAAGLTSRTIATRLGLSPRTVDNHLTSAYAKLGITSRGELPGVLGPG
ncbi:helix-turn-helix transcriptional regulator, partial [Streptomyces sp. NPDC089919]|uniref:helix-turn-helix transcriptional regulator n=1 Tax=Streptomyces sp. NPDC089919 TaxID=3155188 RepID=UPI0034199498